MSQCWDYVFNNSSKCNMYCISTLGWVTLMLLENEHNQILPTAGISQSWWQAGPQAQVSISSPRTNWHRLARCIFTRWVGLHFETLKWKPVLLDGKNAGKLWDSMNLAAKKQQNSQAGEKPKSNTQQSSAYLSKTVFFVKFKKPRYSGKISIRAFVISLTSRMCSCCSVVAPLVFISVMYIFNASCIKEKHIDTSYNNGNVKWKYAL